VIDNMTDAEKIKRKLRMAQERDDKKAIHQETVVKPMMMCLTNDEVKLIKERRKSNPVKKVAKPVKKKPCCKKCGLPIAFKKVGDKWHPTNVDGSDHWDLCNATRREGKPFNPDTDTQSSGFITGANYIETNCDCLPWIGCSKCRMEDK